MSHYVMFLTQVINMWIHGCMHLRNLHHLNYNALRRLTSLTGTCASEGWHFIDAWFLMFCYVCHAWSGFDIFCHRLSHFIVFFRFCHFLSNFVTSYHICYPRIITPKALFWQGHYSQSPLLPWLHILPKNVYLSHTSLSMP